MLTRIEIHGFKTFENFYLDLRPFSAVVGPNASGKSNLFDALKFLSSLAQHDVRTAMQNLRGEPQELFRQTTHRQHNEMNFAVEVLLDSKGVDAFGTQYEIKGQRLRYEVGLAIKYDTSNAPKGIFVSHESCRPLTKGDDSARFLGSSKISYTRRSQPFINMREQQEGDLKAFEIRQDGPAGETGATKRGRPVTLPAAEASRTALSTITTAEFPHLYALRDLFSNIRFLEINPQAARQPSDRFEAKSLKPDASNLAAVLARLKDETKSENRPDGVIADISADLSYLIPSVQSVSVFDSPLAREYSFGVSTAENLNFSSRVISDGTLRLLSLLTLLDDPTRKGILCFEEPENGVHEGRIPLLIELLRDSATVMPIQEVTPLFQILVNTHSPAVMESLLDSEIIAADSVNIINPEDKTKTTKTRMRTGVSGSNIAVNLENELTRIEVERLLRRQSVHA